MDTIQVLLFLGVLQGFFLFFIFLQKKPFQKANGFLAVLLGLMSIQVYLLSMDRIYDWLGCGLVNMFSRLIFLVYGPLIYFYVRSTVDQSFQWTKQQFWHFAPFIIFSVLSVISYQTWKTEYEVDWIIYISNIHYVWPVFHEVGRLLYLLIYLSIAGWWLYQYQKKGLSFFSNLEQFQVKWLYQFLGLSFLLWLVVALGLRVNFYNGNPNANAYQSLFLVLPFFIYWVSYKALVQPSIFSQLALSGASEQKTLAPILPQKSIDKYQRSSLNEQKSNDIEKQLLQFMKTEQPYLNPQLKLGDLAQQLQVSPHHLSQVLNDSLHQNFYEFINTNRIEQAKKLLLSPKLKHYTIEAIAYESGFNSKSTFNATFKKMTGNTPGKWRKMNQNSKKH